MYHVATYVYMNIHNCKFFVHMYVQVSTYVILFNTCRTYVFNTYRTLRDNYEFTNLHHFHISFTESGDMQYTTVAKMKLHKEAGLNEVSIAIY